MVQDKRVHVSRKLILSHMAFLKIVEIFEVVCMNWFNNNNNCFLHKVCNYCRFYEIVMHLVITAMFSDSSIPQKDEGLDEPYVKPHRILTLHRNWTGAVKFIVRSSNHYNTTERFSIQCLFSRQVPRADLLQDRHHCTQSLIRCLLLHHLLDWWKKKRESNHSHQWHILIEINPDPGAHILFWLKLSFFFTQ